MAGAGRLSPSYRTAILLARPALRAAMSRDWHGMENVPRTGGFVACPNHLSYLDPLTVADYLLVAGRPPRFLGKEEVFRVPVLGGILRGAGQIPVYRETAAAGSALRAALAAVKAGECVAVYPDGTLTRDPALWPMRGKTGAARIALSTGVPIIPIAQWGMHEVLAPYGRRLHVWPRRVARVLAGPPVDLSAFAGSPLDADVLTAATDAVQSAVTGLLEQLRGEAAPLERWDPRDHQLPRTGNFRRAGADPGDAPASGERGQR